MFSRSKRSCTIGGRPAGPHPLPGTRRLAHILCGAWCTRGGISLEKAWLRKLVSLASTRIRVREVSPLRSWLLVVGLMLLCPHAVLAQDVGDYVYCSPGWSAGGDKSSFGHAAIYVGPVYDDSGAYLGDVVERGLDGIRFTTMETLRSHYSDVSTIAVPGVSENTKILAAERAVSVTKAIADGQTVPWYSDPYDFASCNCVHTFQHFYLDAGATTEDVGNPRWLSHPGWLYTNFYNDRSPGGLPPGGDTVTGGASSGGVESRPLWLGRSQSPILPTRAGDAAVVEPQSGELLAQFLPPSGLEAEVGHQVTPEGVLGGSNAVAAIGMDYVQESTGRIIGSIFCAETVDSIYEHDYEVCARVQNFELMEAMCMPFGDSWWWLMRAAKPSANCDETVIPLSVRLDGMAAVADSRYLVENYGTSVSGAVLNYQIRGIDATHAMYLLDSILNSVAQTYSLTYANITEPPAPTVFARTATYENPNIRLLVENLGQPHPVRFWGFTWSEPRRDAINSVEYNVEVPAGKSTVDLPVGAIHDAVIYIQAGEFFDKVYVANGYWFAWDDNSAGGTSQVSLTTGEIQHAQMAGAAPWFVSPPLAEMTGVVTDALSWAHVGIGYVFRQGREPIDVSSAESVAFWAKGDGKQYRVKLESASVKDNDYHGLTFTTSPDWQLIRIPFSQLAQEGWGQPIAWTGRDIHTISFVTVGRPHESVHLLVDRICFVQPTVRVKGLTMMSLPIVPGNTDPKLVVGFAGNWWCTYNPAVRAYAVYPDHYTWFDPVETTPGRGFWARFSEEVEMPSGTTPPQNQAVTIHLLPGWNMFGNPFLSSVQWDLDTIKVQEAGGLQKSLRTARDVVMPYAWGWRQSAVDPLRGSYYLIYDSAERPGTADKLMPWQGYWIKANKACDLVIPPP